MKYYELITTKNVVTAATGAGAIYLLAKTLLAALRSPSFKSAPRDLARFSVEYHPAPCARSTLPGELRRTLQSLKPNLDGSSKKAALHTITQCVFLKESEASTCTYDDIKLVASFLDDPEKVIKTEALNALRAFTSIWKFKIKIQEYIPKIIELVARNRDGNLQAAGLRLINGLQLPDHVYTMLKVLLPDFMEILLTADILTKVQVLKLLSTMAQKDDLLYDILNCQVPPEFLSLFHPSLPGNLLHEMLVFVERLNERRLTPQYQSIHWQYNNFSLHSIIFGENSRLSDRLLALIIHPEEEVQIQACKVILSLRLNKEESKVISSLPFSADISSYSNDPSLGNLPFRPRITSSPVTNNVIFDASSGGQQLVDAGHNFQPLQGTNDTSHSSYPHQNAGHNFQALTSSNITSHSVDTINSSPVLLDPMGAFLPIATAFSDEDSEGSDNR
ncbi:PREDICTED: armadillo repeat-containing protein 12-like [Gekko japonicus]|uniref:Armadillo repeat-containing protein 12-like n=1 Tax=Gekko japonicus TaxID=146911 RepID=A0ABM1K0S0_GEKJA|nr:PREDICTED: armadillo repeat-containing protein 12-like [Gekko japonicus]